MNRDDVLLEKDSFSRSGRRRGRQLRVSTWLSAGALGVGVGAAVLTGAAAAHADSGDASGGTGHRADSTTRASGSTGSASRTPQAAATRSTPVRGSVLPAAATPVVPRAVSAPSRVAGQPVTPTVVAPSASTATVVAPPAPKPSSAASATKAPPTGKAAGSFISIFISNGTQEHPDAGVLIGNGFSWDINSCPKSTACDGGRAGFLYGNGGNGWGGGNGGSAGLWGNGGDANPTVRPAFGTPDGKPGGNGGRGGLLFGSGGDGGPGTTGADGGKGGNGGLFFGAGGRGGIGGPGALSCGGQGSENTCKVVTEPGAGGRGGAGGLFKGRAGNGAQALPLDSMNFLGYTAQYPPGGKFPDTGYGPTAITQFGTADGAAPNFGYPNPYYVAGTKVDNITLPKGMALSRWGYATGNFLAPDNTNFAQVAIPPYSQVLPYFEYVVKDPSKFPAGWRIEQSQVAPGFGAYGGGIQYKFYDENGGNGSVQILVDKGYLAYKN